MVIEHEEVEFFFSLFLMDRGDQHTAGVDAHHCSRRQVGDSEKRLSDEFFRLVSTWFETPMKLHYSQTAIVSSCCVKAFETPMKLHYSQTFNFSGKGNRRFETPMKLHYSQTPGNSLF